MNNTKEKVKGSIKENWALMKTPLMSILPGQISFFVVFKHRCLFMCYTHGFWGFLGNQTWRNMDKNIIKCF